MRKHPVAVAVVVIAAFVFAGYLHAPVEGQAGAGEHRGRAE